MLAENLFIRVPEAHAHSKWICVYLILNQLNRHTFYVRRIQGELICALESETFHKIIGQIDLDFPILYFNHHMISPFVHSQLSFYLTFVMEIECIIQAWGRV